LSTIENRILDIVAKILTDFLDIFLVECLIRGKEERYVVDVFLDGDNGIDVEKCAKISRKISRILEEEDFMPSAYVLNVSSPGVASPLRFPRQYPQHVGRDLVVTVVKEGENRIIRGKLTEANSEHIILQPPKTEAVRLYYSELISSKVQLPW